MLIFVILVTQHFTSSLSMFSGAPSEDFLGQEITSNDHAFLKGNVKSIGAYRRGIKGELRFHANLSREV